jgi:DNA polymerase-3 subunit delta
MNTILQHIETTTYCPVYLLYGPEDYQKRKICHQLKSALVAEDDTMNISTLKGETFDEKEIIELSQTLPFFQDHRVILLEDSKLLTKCSDEFFNNLNEIPDTTVIILLEETVDKRSRLYKWIQKNGYVAEFQYLKEEELKSWISDYLSKNKKTMDGVAIQMVMERTEGKLTAIENELQKLLLYAETRDQITVNDVKALVTEPVTNQIFRMISAISEGKPKVALKDYFDLLTLKESPMRILFLIVREYNMIFRTKNLVQQGKSDGEIASRLGVPPFAVKKYKATGKQHSYAELKTKLNQCAKMEKMVKSGEVNERIAIEMLILQFSNR